MFLSSYIIFDKNLENNDCYNHLRRYLNDLGLTENTIIDGMNIKKKHKFIWFRHINCIDNKILNKFYCMSFFLTNVISNVECITNKYILYENMKKLVPDTFLKIMPYSFKITNNTIYEKDTVYIARPVNIIKYNYPANKGYGIVVYDNEETLKNIKKTLNEFDVIISSKYITNPMLFQEKKFHLRCNMFITIINNKLSGHVFDTYKILRAKEPYKNEDYQNKNIHDSHYITDDENTYLFPKHFTMDNISNIIVNNSVIQHIYKQIKNTCRLITIIASKNVKLLSNTLNSFHLIGCDFIVDSNLNVLLLECNRFSDIAGAEKYAGEYKIFLERFWKWIHHIILKPAFLNDNSCDKDAVYITDFKKR
jgi:hypothetical protein